jgi:hypothetical protein
MGCFELGNKTLNCMKWGILSVLWNGRLCSIEQCSREGGHKMTDSRRAH